MKAFFDACDSTCPAEEKNIEDFCKEIAGQICSCAAEQKKQAGFRNEREEEAWQRNCNLFMVAYVFPAILLTEHDDAKLIADHLCSRWGEKFKNSKIQYTDYDSLYVSFREKIFGIF